MSQTNASENPLANLSREELMSALLANMVVQQTNMALMFLGKTPHPETGETMRDLDMAQLFIDQLEMLEAKTKGNLDAREQGILKQSLMTVRMAFVEAANEPPPASAAGQNPGPTPEAAPAAPTPESTAAPGTEAGAAAEAEARKKFSKKY
jgi:hypothetical protein